MDSGLKLFEATLDGKTLTEDEENVLDQWLLENPGAVREAMGAAWNHELICRQFAASPSEPIDSSAARAGASPDAAVQAGLVPADGRRGAGRLGLQPKLPSRSTKAIKFPSTLWRRWTIAAAALLGLGLSLLWRSENGSGGFQVIEAVEAVLADGSVVEAGRRIAAGEMLQLTKGSVQLCRDHAALIVVQAPAEFRIESDAAVFLRRGKLRARVNSGGPFIVRTPQAAVVDLGTEFGVRVEKESEHVAVFDGAVEVSLAGRSKSTPLALVAGRQAMIGRDGRLESSAFDAAEDRVFALSDEAAWRRQVERMEQGADHPELQGIDGLLAIHRFDAGTGHKGPTFGFQRVMLHENLNGARVGTSRATRTRAEAGLMIERQEVVELVPETDFSGRFAAAGWIDENGCVRPEGGEIWLAWRVRHDAGMTPRGGLALAKALDGKSQTQLFVGVPPEGSTYLLTAPTHRVGDAEAFSTRVWHPRVDAAREAGEPDQETHSWIVRLRFYENLYGRGAASVWCDVDSDSVDANAPLAEMSNVELAFNRILLYVEEGSPGMQIDYVVVAERPDAILKALQAR